MTSTPDTRLPCPACGVPVARLRKSCGIVAAYPCTHWLTPDQAAAMMRRWRDANPQ
ncbi:hypothetical protein ABZ671_00715 [Micromonospora sp. NPDC006766]|uniref:hypothetical protein n=1 Tax=Micromonospora sp. NPDC006766 TaxID=3154778 RepID=UPI00340C37D9